MKIEVSNDEIERIFQPSVHRELDQRDVEWLTTTERIIKKGNPPPLKRLRNLIGRRDEKKVKRIYDTKWSSEDVLKRLDFSGERRSAPLVWRDRCFFAHDKGTKRVQLLYLMRIIEQLKPARVLEIGSGMGQNLAILSAKFPQIKFTGIELTAAGVEAAQRLLSTNLPVELVNYSPLPLSDLAAPKSVVVRQASAAKLPFHDASFDLVYSIQALEQMNEIKQDALGEIVRVCGGHAVMFEPFADWNATPERSRMVSGRQYFNLTISEIAGYGLNPIYSSDNLPTSFIMALASLSEKSSDNGITAPTPYCSSRRWPAQAPAAFLLVADEHGDPSQDRKVAVGKIFGGRSDTCILEASSADHASPAGR